MGDNYIATACRVDRLPGRIPRAVVIQTLLDVVRAGRDAELPAGWEVTLRWQNARGGPWREAPFDRAVRESEIGQGSRVWFGFSEVIRRQLEAQAGALPAPPREATEAEQRALDEAEEETAEARRGRKPGQATRRRARAEFRRRRAAALKGWETRRRREAAEARARAAKRVKARKIGRKVAPERAKARRTRKASMRPRLHTQKVTRGRNKRKRGR